MRRIAIISILVVLIAAAIAAYFLLKNEHATTIAVVSMSPAEREYLKKHVILERIAQEPGKGITGVIRNTGDKTIDSLKLTVYFLPAQNTTIEKKDYTLISPLSLFNPSKPLYPDESREFGYMIDEQAPEGWSGRAKVDVSRIGFEEEGN